MPEVIDTDALLFASLRATYLESPRQVADDLLAAASWPAIRLKGVSAYRARMQAAKLLSEAGDHAGALEVLDSSPDTAGAGLIKRASVCVGSGDVASAQALVSQIGSWPVDDGYGLALIIEFVLSAANGGHFEQAIAWTDAAWEAACSNRSGPDWLVSRGAALLRLAGEEIRQSQQRHAGGGQAQGPESRIEPARAAGPERALLARSDPWPALADGRLLWWPEREYQRLVAQVPDITGLLGITWQQHRANVESALRAAQLQGNGVALSLVRAEFVAYVGFLEKTGADPRLPEAMTAFTGFAAKHQKQNRWPPGRLDRCWCDSGRRYSRCCGAPAGG